MQSYKFLKDLMLRAPRLTLAAAESVTCGRVQARIGEISGASEFFLGGLTAYSLEQKVRHLDVNRAEAEEVDCVSAPIAEQMARGACKLFGSDLALATTGYAEVSVEKKIAAPFAFWALAHRRGGKFITRAGRVDDAGLARMAMQERVAEAALAALVGYLHEMRDQSLSRNK